MAPSPAVLKQQAAALELKKQPEKALALYQKLLSEHDGSEDVDVSLRNRVGDLHLRLGQIDEAILLFERSADEYALSGFLNNAIALCNKILRQRPGHVSTLRRLARFSAEKGMVVDAQRHYLSVAEALETLGQHGEALKALSEFAELSPNDVHVRSVVIEQLLRAGRKPDALPHLTVLHRLHMVANRSGEADGVAQVARDIDPAWVAESEEFQAGKRTDLSLILIASDADFGALETSPMLDGAGDRPATASAEGLELTACADPGLSAPPQGATVDGFEATSFDHSEEEVAADEAPLETVELSGLPLLSATQEADSVESIEFLDDEEPLQDGPGHVQADAHALSALHELPTAGFGETSLGDLAFDILPDDGFSSSTPESFNGMSAQPDGALAFADLFPIDPEPPAPPPVMIASPPPVRPRRPTPTYVSLADILRDDEPATTRMTISEPQQTGDHDADFEHILQEFRDGIEKSISIDDADSHFDLGIAFREMGLLDDAISEFQIAARSRLKRVESIEALGGCFLDKCEPAIARTILQRALEDPSVRHTEDTLLGVLYLLGRASEEVGARDDGLRYYQRVYAVDIRFRDVAVRIQNLQQPA